jgi:hypothetical protein
MINLSSAKSTARFLAKPAQKKANFRAAVRKAFTAFSRDHPDWVAALFDEHFLLKIAEKVLTDMRGNPRTLDPSVLADVWADQVWMTQETRKKMVRELTPVAFEFLDRLFAEMN